VFLILGFFGSEVYRQAPIGTGALAYFMIGLWTGWSYEPSDVTVRETLPGSVPSLGD
jgi:hypothetical protein